MGGGGGRGKGKRRDSRIGLGEHGAAEKGTALAEGGEEGETCAALRVATVVVEKPCYLTANMSVDDVVLRRGE